MKFNKQPREKTQKPNTGRRYKARGCVTAAVTNVIGWNTARGPALPLRKGQCSQHGDGGGGTGTPVPKYRASTEGWAGPASRAGPPQGKKAQGKGWEGRGEIAWARTFPFGGLRDAQHSSGEGPAAPPMSAGGGQLQAAGEQRRAAGPLLPPGAELGWAGGGPAPPPRSSPPRPAPPRLARSAPAAGERSRGGAAFPGLRQGRGGVKLGSPKIHPQGGCWGRAGLASPQGCSLGAWVEGEEVWKRFGRGK